MRGVALTNFVATYDSVCPTCGADVPAGARHSCGEPHQPRTCPDRIVSYLEAELAARTTSQIAAGLGEPAARVRNYVSRLAREGRVIRVDFAGAKCPACQQRLSRALTVYTVARAGWGAAAQDDARAEPYNAAGWRVSK